MSELKQLKQELEELYDIAAKMVDEKFGVISRETDKRVTIITMMRILTDLRKDKLRSQ